MILKHAHKTLLIAALLLVLTVILPVFAFAPMSTATAAPHAQSTKTTTVKVVARYKGNDCAWCTGLKTGQATMWSNGKQFTGTFNQPGRIARDLVIYFYNVPIDTNSSYSTGNIEIKAYLSNDTKIKGTWQGRVTRSWRGTMDVTVDLYNGNW